MGCDQEREQLGKRVIKARRKQSLSSQKGVLFCFY